MAIVPWPMAIGHESLLLAATIASGHGNYHGHWLWPAAMPLAIMVVAMATNPCHNR